MNRRQFLTTVAAAPLLKRLLALLCLSVVQGGTYFSLMALLGKQHTAVSLTSYFVIVLVVFVAVEAVIASRTRHVNPDSSPVR